MPGKLGSDNRVVRSLCSNNRNKSPELLPALGVQYDIHVIIGRVNYILFAFISILVYNFSERDTYGPEPQVASIRDL